jgi:two-component system, OmpR family, response regulator TctD
VADGWRADAILQEKSFDLILLDLSLPQLDGLEVLRRLRARSVSTPVLILTARGTVEERVAGLNAGADDYLPKPFDLDELEARAVALLRRTKSASSADVLRFSDLSFTAHDGAFYLAGELLSLSPREHKLLIALIEKAGSVVRKEALFSAVFAGNEDANMEAIEVCVHRVRKKLHQSSVTIQTMRGLGYLLKQVESVPDQSVMEPSR